MGGRSDTTLKINVLGRFEVWRDGKVLSPEELGRRKCQNLLKLLLTKRGRVFTADQLIEALFPCLDPDKAVKNLRARISELRRLLEPSLKRGSDSQYVLRIGQAGYCFSETAPCWIDGEVLQRQIESAEEAERMGRWPEAIERYQQALILYQGGYLPEDLYEEWTLTPREQLKATLLGALNHLADCHSRLRQYDRAIECCQRIMEADPYNENAFRKKMLCHYHAGEHGKALQTYRTCVQVLKQHLDVEPMPEIRELYEQILKQEVPPAPHRIPNNLPYQLTSFVGRQKEIQDIGSLLSAARLVTLTGAGGCGKTRLALKIATELQDGFNDGVWLVDLAPLSDATLILQTVASTLRVTETADGPLTKTLKGYLQHKTMLLILDNCEHLIETCARLAEDLLVACPNLRILATSREELGVAGEVLYPVLPLSLPEKVPSRGSLEEYDAVRLLVDRTRSSRPDFAVTERNASAVAQVCQRLDGLPLAIELAAAQTKALSVQQIVERLDHCFQLLTSSSRTALPKHQTLRAAMDWSYALLSQKEQTLLRRLAIFAGRFTLEAVEETCAGTNIKKGDLLNLLTQLVKKSLVVLDRQVDETRYRLLETVRQYGWEKLSESGELDELRTRHRDFYLRLAEQAEPQLQSTDRWDGLVPLEQEQDGLRAALLWSLESGQIEEGLRLAGALGSFWRMRCQFTEGRNWLESLLSKGKSASASARAKALLGIGWLALWQGDYVEAKQAVEEGLALYRRLGDEAGIARSLNCLGGVAYSQNKLGVAHGLFEESLAICQKLSDKDKWFIAGPLGNLGLLAQLKEEYETARTFYEKQLSINRETGSRFGEAVGLANLANLALAQGMCPAARRFLTEAVRIHQELGNKLFVAIDFTLFAKILRVEGNAELAARLLGATEGTLRSVEGVFGSPEFSTYERELSAGEQKLGKEDFKRAFAEGRALTLDQAIAVALGEAFDD